MNEDEEDFESSQLAWNRTGRRCYQIRLSTAILSMTLAISLICNLIFLLPIQKSPTFGKPIVSPQGTHWGQIPCLVAHVVTH